MADPTWDESEPVEDIPTWEESEEVGGTASQLRTPSSIGAAAGIAGAASQALEYPSRLVRSGISKMQGYDETPEWSTILGRAGVSEKKSIPNPIATNPFDPESKLSPAQVGGAVAGVAADPLTYVGGVLPAKAGAKIGQGVDKSRAALANYLKGVAEDRAAKTALGRYITPYRQAAAMTGRGVPDLGKAEQKIRNVGRQVLDDKLIGRFSKAEDVQKAAIPKWREAGEGISDVLKTLDESGTQISGDDIANQMVEYAAKLPTTERNKKLQESILTEAQNFQGRMFTASEAQDIKNSFKFSPTESTAWTGDKDVTNKFKQAFGDAIDNAAESASRTLRASQDPALQQAGARLAQYPEMKQKYGTYKNVGMAGSNEWLMDLKNRAISPSDYMMGAAGMIQGGPIAGMVAGGVNQMARERGSAFVARAAEDLRKIIGAKPQIFSKWGNALGKAAAAGNTSLISAHHLLMQSDPEYRNAITNAATEDVPRWEDSE